MANITPRELPNIIPVDLSTNEMYVVIAIALIGGILFYLISRVLMFFDKLKIKRKVRDSGGKLKEIKNIKAYESSRYRSAYRDLLQL